MKKYVPFVVLLLGIVVLGAVFFLIRGKSDETIDEDEVVAEIPMEKRPVVSLTPTNDGHWLNLLIDNIVFDAEMLDYELLYSLPDGRTQGVPGSIALKGQKSIERELLLGSESSGKFRYDEGVESGILTLRFRNDKGKLTGKLSTEFRLLSGVGEIEFKEGGFSYTFDEEPKEGFFVVMNSFGAPENAANIEKGPIGIFSSEEGPFPGKIKLEGNVVKHWDGVRWEIIEGDDVQNIGIFISSPS